MGSFVLPARAKCATMISILVNTFVLVPIFKVKRFGLKKILQQLTFKRDFLYKKTKNSFALETRADIHFKAAGVVSSKWIIANQICACKNDDRTLFCPPATNWRSVGCLMNLLCVVRVTLIMDTTSSCVCVLTDRIASPDRQTRNICISSERSQWIDTS